MADLIINNGKSRRKGKPSRMNLRVDFTPMVDMNMLLITFFMFCTTLATPQVMDIVMPTKDPHNKGESEYPASKTITLLLGENNKVFYYLGIPDYNDMSSLKETNLSESGLRSILLNSNADIIVQIRNLKEKRRNKEISEETFKTEISQIRKSKEGQMVIIKPTHNASYSDLIQTLDEMQICNISRYAIVDLEDGDKYFLNNYQKRGNIAELKK